MKKTITVGGKEVPFKATASTPLRYREFTGRDLFKDLLSISTASQSGAVDFDKFDSEIVQKLAYTMAKQADPDIAEYVDWLDEFEPYDIFPGATGAILALWGASQEPLSKSKKK
jgi:hypothetical protein